MLLFRNAFCSQQETVQLAFSIIEVHDKYAFGLVRQIIVRLVLDVILENLVTKSSTSICMPLIAFCFIK